MKVWKRNALIAYLVCSLVVLVVFLLLLAASEPPWFLGLVLVLVALVSFAGVVAGALALVYALLHEQSTLHAGPEGVITIERSALESTARNALDAVDGIAVQKVVARVVERKGDAVIDITVTAVPVGAESLMTAAGRIQAAAKQAVETFTDHEVRYVAVNFVEPRGRGESKAASIAEKVRNRFGLTHAAHARDAKPGATSEGTRSVGAENRASLWGRVKERVAEARAKGASPDEDVVETVAVVESVEFAEPVREAVACDLEPEVEKVEHAVTARLAEDGAWGEAEPAQEAQRASERCQTACNGDESVAAQENKG